MRQTVFSRAFPVFPRRIAIAAWIFAFAFAAGAVEIPEGIQANCTRGEFGKNKYATLKAALVEQWVENAEGGGVDLVGVVLDIAKPPAGGDRAEKVSIAFMVVDAEMEQRSPVLGGAVRDSGPVMFKWDFLDGDGKRVPDGAYKVIMNITGEYHGDLLRGAVFPLYLVSAAPIVDKPIQSSDKAVLEYGGAPSIGFTSENYGVALLVDSDADGDEVNRWEGVLGPGKHSFKSDLLDKDKDPLPPGDYTTQIIMQNNLGQSEVLAYEYTVVEPPPLELSVKLDAGATVQVEDDTSIPFTIRLNQSAYLKVEHVADSGQVDLIGKSTEEEPAALYQKGEHTLRWHRVDMAKMEFYASGSHTIRVTATTLAGEKKTAQSFPVKLTPAPKPPPPPKTAAQPAKKEPVRTVPNVTLSLNPDSVLIGGRMSTAVKYTFDQDSMIKITVYDKNDRVIKRLVNSQNEHIKKGSYSVGLNLMDYDYGSYKVVFVATNFYGTKSATKYLHVTWR